MSWPVHSLGSISDRIDYGLTASAVDNEDGPRFLRITDMQEDSVDWNTVPSCICSSKEYEQNRLEDGDIVFARTGATTGKSYLVRELKWLAVFASYLIRVRPNKKVDSLYLSYFFKSSRYWHQITAMANGAAQPGVNSSKLRELEIPLPPLAEQKRIASILDKADAIRRKRQLAINLADEFLRAVFLDMFGDPVTNPKGWEMAVLGDVLESIDSGNSPKCEARRVELGEWGVLKLGAVSYCTFEPDENKAIYDHYVPNPSHEVKVGDLLFTRKNTSDLVAAVAVVENTRPKLLLPDLVFRLNTRPTIDKHFLWKMLIHSGMRKKVQTLASGAAGSMPNISKANLRTVEIVLPPIKKQNEFRALCMKVSELTISNSKSASSLEDIFGSIGKQAFSGCL